MKKNLGNEPRADATNELNSLKSFGVKQNLTNQALIFPEKVKIKKLKEINSYKSSLPNQDRESCDTTRCQM